MRIEDRVDDVDARLSRVSAEVQGLMQMPGIYGAEYGKIRTALEGHDKRFDHLDATLEQHGERFGEHDRRFDHLEELISDQGQVLREHTRRFDRVDATLADHGQVLHEHTTRFDRIEREHAARFDRIEEKLSDQGDALSRCCAVMVGRTGGFQRCRRPPVYRSIVK